MSWMRPSAPVVAAVALLLLGAAAGVLFATGVVGGSGGLRADSVIGTPEDDQLSGTEGDDFLFAGNAKDSVKGRGGDDRIAGGDDEDFLYGGAGNDRFLMSEDDAVDVHDCGAGKDLVAKPDTRDELLPDCEEAGWSAVPLSEASFENTLTVTPALAPRTADFEGSCPDACEGVIELRTPRDRRVIGKGRFRLAAGERGRVRAVLSKSGDEFVRRGGYVRVVLRSRLVNTGFTTFIQG